MKDKIKRVKDYYDKGESRVDNFMVWLSDKKYTLAILVVILVVLIVWAAGPK